MDQNVLPLDAKTDVIVHDVFQTEIDVEEDDIAVDPEKVQLSDNPLFLTEIKQDEGSRNVSYFAMTNSQTNLSAEPKEDSQVIIKPEVEQAEAIKNELSGMNDTAQVQNSESQKETDASPQT